MRKRLDLKSAWNAQQLQDDPNWKRELTDSELSELSSALEKNADIPEDKVTEITKEQFPLPTFGRTISEVFSEQLENGLGTLLLSGAQKICKTDRDFAILTWGVGLYLGIAVSQSVDGERLHQVKDEGYKLGEQKARGTNTNIKLWFHNDTCDVAALTCVRPAEKGGVSQVVSSAAIHNKMLEDSPELVEELHEPYYFKRHNVNTTQPEEYFRRPIFSNTQGFFACNILRPMIDQAQKLEQVPKMTKNQVAALDALERLAESPELCHEFYLKRGDMWFVNNFVTLHSRRAFEDNPDPAKKRLLYRLWLSTPNSRPLDESYRVTYHNTEPGSVRGGIRPAAKK